MTSTDVTGTPDATGAGAATVAEMARPVPPAPAVTAEGMARAVLTFCADGPDALMFAALKGAGSATRLLRLVAHTEVATTPCWLDDADGERTDAAGTGTTDTNTAGRLTRSGPDGELDRVFVVGTARWGRRADPRAVVNFHNAVRRWRERLDCLPVGSWTELADRFTCSGGQWIIDPSSPYWPHQLDDLAIRSDWAPPLCLWGMGDPDVLVGCEAPVAVVGSREVTDYGRFVAGDVARCAARHGHLVVSGGAMGADAAAHWGALAARDERRDGDDPDHAGRTVAVFAGGLDRRGPARNMALFDAILEGGGALVGEMPPGTVPEARRFLLRNRIIAAMARVVVIAQARHRSGALNTATWAAEMNREIYAAPGTIDEPHNTGCNRLVREGRAMLLASTADIGAICHEPHTPHAIGADAAEYGETAPFPPDPSVPFHIFQTPAAQAAARAATLPAGGETDAGDERDAILACHRDVVTAIRSCVRRHTPATPDALLEYLQTRRPSLHYDASSVQSELGAMETAGVITVHDDGTVALTRKRKGGSRRS